MKFTVASLPTLKVCQSMMPCWLSWSMFMTLSLEMIVMSPETISAPCGNSFELMSASALRENSDKANRRVRFLPKIWCIECCTDCLFSFLSISTSVHLKQHGPPEPYKVILIAAVLVFASDCGVWIFTHTTSNV